MKQFLLLVSILYLYKKYVQIPMGYSESLIRRTDNTMAKRKRTKRTNNNLQNTHIKLNIE